MTSGKQMTDTFPAMTGVMDTRPTVNGHDTLSRPPGRLHFFTLTIPIFR
jgi:hypothetical protein